MRILQKVRDVVPVSDMRDGEIAVIKSWMTSSGSQTSIYNGTIVQRYGDSLVVLGKGRGDSWVTLFSDKYSPETLVGCEVQILKPGTKLEI